MNAINRLPLRTFQKRHLQLIMECAEFAGTWTTIEGFKVRFLQFIPVIPFGFSQIKLNLQEEGLHAEW